MNTKSTLILLALVTALGLAYYFMMLSTQSPSSNPIITQRQSELLLTLDGQPLSARQIQQISIIKRGNPEPLTLAKKANTWQQTSPVQFPLDQEYITQLLNAITTLRFTESFPLDSPNIPSTQDIGLEDPHAIITLKLENNTDITIILGNETIGGNAYLTLNQSPTIYVTSNLFQQVLTTAEPQNLWTASLSLPPESKLNQFTLKTPEFSQTFYANGNSWYLNRKATARANTNNIKQLFTQLTPLKIKPLETKLNLTSEQIFSESNTVATLTCSLAGQNYTLKIGPSADLKKQYVYASLASPLTSTDAVFTIDSDTARILTENMNYWQDNKLFDIPKDRFRSMTMRNADQSIRLAVSYNPITATFSYLNPMPSYPIDQQFTNIYINSLLQAEGSAYIALSKPLAKPFASITINQYRSAIAQTINLYSFDSTKHDVTWITTDHGSSNTLTTLAVRPGETVGYLLTDEQLAMLNLSAIDLRDRTMVDLSVDLPNSITLKRSDAPAYKFDNASGDWSLEGTSSRFERLAFNKLLAALSPLRAEQWHSQMELPNHDISLTLTYRQDSPPTEIFINSRTQNAQIQTSKTSSVFKLNKQIIDLLNLEYRDRTILNLLPSQIISININNNQLIARNRRSEYICNGLPISDQSIPASIINALSSLHADRMFVDLPKAEVKQQNIFTIKTKSKTYSMTIYQFDGTSITYGQLTPPSPARTITFTMPKQAAESFDAAVAKLPKLTQ
ncbi:hypothetical protein KS4_16950 [Poriferisphaera corsica]|uniref:DUF4340 domain-containing protein n=1 Tax=Poriferisphaera corsica TaxID=2528020 RepID=A0A517YTT0_9BACT|nr:DUF4340 domain-containing protein [Poriferisphaera corsica]QDU33640.1 hypothetical protein KS4_16950 [Poriferisphaera corsica]